MKILEGSPGLGSDQKVFQIFIDVANSYVLLINRQVESNVYKAIVVHQGVLQDKAIGKYFLR